MYSPFFGIVHFIGCPISKGLVQPFLVVQVKVFRQSVTCFGNRAVIMNVDFLVLDRSPESFDEDIVEYAATAVHADSDAGIFKGGCEVRARELRPLVGVENSRLAEGQGHFQGMDTKRRVQSRGKGPGQDIAAEPVP